MSHGVTCDQQMYFGGNMRFSDQQGPQWNSIFVPPCISLLHPPFPSAFLYIDIFLCT